MQFRRQCRDEDICKRQQLSRSAFIASLDLFPHGNRATTSIRCTACWSKEADPRPEGHLRRRWSRSKALRRAAQAHHSVPPFTGMTIVTEQRADLFRGKTTPIAGWFVSVGHPLVQQRFYAAIDINGGLCWTDDPAIAEQFPMRQDAECFARLACLGEDWSVEH